MSLKKLSEADKNEILRLYRETEATTSTLAEQFEVSSSTVSRFLKGSIPLPEYEELIQRKRLARTPSRRSAKKDVETIENITQDKEEPVSVKKEKKITTIYQEKSVASPEVMEAEIESKQEDSLFNLFQETSVNPDIKTDHPKTENWPPVYDIEQLNLFPLDHQQDQDEDSSHVEVLTLEQLLGEDIGDLDEEYEEEEDLEEDEEEDREDNLTQLTAEVSYSLEILPLSQAIFPKVCYLVIDRQAELITRPLREFRELGQIPLKEIQEQTLPIFDNHKIARRFSSSRREKVIKVPDSSLFEKTASYLQAKGITRILLDGRVYALD